MISPMFVDSKPDFQRSLSGFLSRCLESLLDRLMKTEMPAHAGTCPHLAFCASQSWDLLSARQMPLRGHPHIQDSPFSIHFANTPIERTY
jgi:hypothetical protein